MTSVIATMRSPLQALISSVDNQFVAFICKGGVTWIANLLRVSDLFVDGHGVEIKVWR
jgi:hypothetical protein